MIASAQNRGGVIQGVVNDTENHPLNLSSVYLLNAADSSVIKFTTTNKAGVFKFSNITYGQYIINVNCTGYQKNLSPKFILNSTTGGDLGIIQLKASSTKLGEVMVTSQKNFIDVKPGKLTLNVQNSVLSVGNTVLEILRRAPGVQIDNNDNISLNGRPDVLVTIDGKPTYLTGTALSELLQGTPSSMIDKIELINNANSNYDASAAGGVINIKLKRDKSLGLNAQLAGGGAITQPDFGYNSELTGNAGFNLNYRTKSVNIFGGYGYISMPYNRLSTSDRVTELNNQMDLISVNWFTNQRREANILRVGADYNVNALISLVWTALKTPPLILQTRALSIRLF
jgi:hypothetical protein